MIWTLLTRCVKIRSGRTAIVLVIILGGWLTLHAAIAYKSIAWDDLRMPGLQNSGPLQIATSWGAVGCDRLNNAYVVYGNHQNNDGAILEDCTVFRYNSLTGQRKALGTLRKLCQDEGTLKAGEEIPKGWVYPSVAPFLDGDGVVPMSVLQYPLGGEAKTGGYKGYGLALLVDILSGVLSGAHFGSRLASSKIDAEADIGHFFGALSLRGFRSMEEFERDFDLLVKDVKSSPREAGVDRILIPGEPEIEKKVESLRRGIPLLPSVLEKLTRIASELNLSFSPCARD